MNRDTKTSLCLQCGETLPVGLIGGLCPRCTAAFYLAPRTDDDDSAAESSKPAKIASTHKDLAIRERIGEGGMGEIFAATDAELDRTVAIKWLKAERQHDSAARSRFLAEAKITGQLEHPGIVPVYEMGVGPDGRVFYTMRRIKGVTLAQILADLKEQKAATIQPYSLTVLLTIFQKACDAVAYAHSRKIIHRDLKPENIMVGEFGEVLVMDWGLAKVLSGSPGSNLTREEPLTNVSDPTTDDRGPILLRPTHRTLDEVVIGSPGFMAPEQAEGRAHESDMRTDIFGLGAILYSILTLRAPVEGQSPQSVIDRTRSGVIRAPSDFNRLSTKAGMLLSHCPDGRVPVALSAVAMKALARRPDDRYQSVKELQAEIAAHQNGYATDAEAAGLLTHLALFLRRRRTEMALAAGALAIVLVLTAVFVWRVTTTLKELQSTAPSFAAEARTLVEQGNLDAALEKIRYAERLAPHEAEYHYCEGNILQALLRLKEAREAYAATLKISLRHELANRNLRLCDEILRANGEKETLSSENIDRLRSAIVEQGRVAEAVAVGQTMRAGGEALLEKRREYLRQVGFPGTLNIFADGGLELNASHTAISNLSVLKGMPLSRLDVSFTAISDLNPLREMPLRWLDVQSTQVTNLIPIRGLPLQHLNVSRTQVSDFSPLKGMKINYLIAQVLLVNDLTPLKGLPLRYLNLYRCTEITDLKPLTGMQLEILDLYKTRMTDIKALREMPLKSLDLDDTIISDLSPLKGVPLTSLNLITAPVSDLSPLRGMNLTELELRETQVSDLEPLRNMPLKDLLLNGCVRLKDITALESCRDLERLTIPRTVTNVHVLRTLPKLQKLGYVISFSRNWDEVSSTEDFWKAYEAEQALNP